MEYKKILTLSFDDGITQDERFIEILNKYGIKCTFNINSDLLGTDSYLMINGKKISHKKIASERVRQVYKGHEVASHTLTHPNLTALSPCEIIEQVEKDRLKLSELAGYDVTGFAYPCGGINSNRVTGEIIKHNTGVKFARTIVHSYDFSLPDNMYLLKPTVSLTKDKNKLFELCRKFIDSNPVEPQLLYIWGHSYELDVDDSWEYFEEVCRLLGGRGDIFYCTNTEAFDYLVNLY